MGSHRLTAAALPATQTPAPVPFPGRCSADPRTDCPGNCSGRRCAGGSRGAETRAERGSKPGLFYGATSTGGIMTLSIVPFRQQVAMQRVDDVAATIRAGLWAIPLRERIRPGMRIAVGVGSRGISCIYEVVHTLIEELHAL